MTDYVSSIAVDSVIDALKAFLTPFLPNTAQIVRGQVNRVPQPTSPCVVLTEISEIDLCVPYIEYQPSVQTATIHGPTQIGVQIDFYGEASGDYCKAFKAAFRSEWAFSVFPSNIKPLYASDGMQGPLITGEQQYEGRWTVTASIQYNPVVTLPQASATQLAMNDVSTAD